MVVKVSSAKAIRLRKEHYAKDGGNIYNSVKSVDGVYVVLKYWESETATYTYRNNFVPSEYLMLN